MERGYVEAVLDLVDEVPFGRVTTYGAIARAVGAGGPRQVGRVMALYGDAVPWWRVVHADGMPATCHDGAAEQRLADEGVPLRRGSAVDLAAAAWDFSKRESA
jgi:alkylated DNA nucleotide flippase Atl1